MTDPLYDGQLLRAITKDGAFRVICVNCTSVVEDIFRWQNPPESLRESFAKLIMGAILVRETMSPNQRVQATLKKHNGTSLMADAHPEGMTRGLTGVVEPAEEFSLGATTALAITRVLYNHDLHQGVVSTDEALGLDGAFSSYFLQSEQVSSVVQLGVVWGDDGAVEHVGGFVVQLLPEVTKEVLRPMTTRLDEMSNFGQVLDDLNGNPEAIMAFAMEGFEYEVLATESVAAGCTCSADRVIGAMATLGREEIQEIVTRGEMIEIQCDYCQTEYNIGPQQLKPLLDVS